MPRPKPAKLAAICAGLIAFGVAPVLLAGGLAITHYDGDALHLADILMRMRAGQRLHVDIMTPLGALGFWPIHWAMAAGAPLGLAFVLGQAAVAAVLAVPLTYATATRLPAGVGYGFVAAAMILAVSLTHGTSGTQVAVSMHYNRWAWVVAFVVLLLAALPGTGRVRLDGALIGLGLVALGMLKVSYVAAVAPAALLILAARRARGELAAAAVAGLATLGALCVRPGVGHLLAYLGDVRAVAGAGIRAYPGLPLGEVLVAPAFLPATLAALAGAYLLRRAGRNAEAVSVLLLLPGFVFVTYQNFGNDPMWLVLLAALLAAWGTALPALRLVAFAAAVLALPMVHAHALGGVRLLSLPRAGLVPLVPGVPELADLQLPARPAMMARARVDLTAPGRPFAALAGRLPEEGGVRFQGRNFADCQLSSGFSGMLELTAAALAEEPARIFVADVVSPVWLYRGTEPLPGAPPWNYGTLHGVGAAEFVLVPRCAVSVRVRDEILRRLAAAGPALTLRRAGPLFILYTVAPSNR